MTAPSTLNGTLEIEARPHSISWNPLETALIVVDMQNGFCSPGGYLDKVGYDLSGARSVIEVIARLLPTVRRAGVKVVFLQSGFDKGYKVVGGPTAPVWHKSEALLLMRSKPELQGSLITEGGWDWELVDELVPEENDIVVRKSRYGGFSGTNLDQILRAYRIRNLIFTGIATNVCVETTLRESYGLEYFPLLLEDATHQAGPPEMKSATLTNVERYFGWVASSKQITDALNVATNGRD
jgi:ureidoacrylate peracid hydrolase